MSESTFDDTFRHLTGSDPFPWQRALYDRFVGGDVPSTCDIPTGLGKTSVIAIWLAARAAGAPLPRRLVYIVNRRTVVDQTTDEVRKLQANLASAGIASGLEISTLRGQMADNRAWSADPSKQAVVCGTVDMIGSRLLFSGYRIGFRTRPLHAGFLGQDALLVHDEAHLEPAFQRLLESIHAEQGRERDPWPLRLMALTATSRGGPSPFHIGAEDEQHPVVSQRLHARKRLTLHPLGDQALVDAVATQALSFQGSGRAVVVFLRSVADVAATVAKLRKAGAAVQQLTGTMRGYEREQLVESDRVFARFLRGSDAQPEDPSETVYLLCTSAGEVGVNLSADHLVCDLSTFDSMAQRFGRLNRFGLRGDSEAHVWHPESTDLDADDPVDLRRAATLKLLEQLEGLASPAALGALDPASRRAAFAPEPRILEATDILFDAWATTTITETLPGRPPVDPYLHGVADWEPPTTQVAWRQEVALITEGWRRRYPPQDLLDDYPLKPQELLSDRTARVLDTLQEMAKRSSAETFPVWVLDQRGRVRNDLTNLADLVTGDRRTDEARLAGATLLLSPEHCHPLGGLLTSDGLGAPDATRADVADEWFDEKGKRLRIRVWEGDEVPSDLRLIRTLVLVDDELEAEGQDDDQAQRAAWRWYELPRAADNDGSRSASRAVLLDVHSGDVEREATRIVAGLRLDPDVGRAVVIAARLHDIGKERRVWQLSIGNRDRSVSLAKSGRGMEPMQITAYRHELGSTLDAADHDLFASLSDDQRDLAMHLIAAHHGRARPHFPPDELFDPDAGSIDMADVGANVVARFARLQKRFGRWGLAYLESLVRAADYAASANPSQVVES